MSKHHLDDLATFIVVAEEKNFTRAAKRLGISQSALSQTILALEARLGLRLLTRTTRRVSLTPAGERMLHVIAPRIEEIQLELKALGDLRDKPSGSIRISATEYTAEAILWPAVSGLIKLYPDIDVEVSSDYGFVDIVQDRFDAGIRPGDTVEKDMIAVRVGPDIRMSVAGSPDYFSSFPAPRTPNELTEHNCINLRLPRHGGMYAWEFEKGGQRINVRVKGQLVFNSGRMVVNAALGGHGLIYLPESQLAPYLNEGQLVRVLDDWCRVYTGYHLYYPRNRQPTQAFSLLVEALRHNGKS